MQDMEKDPETKSNEDAHMIRRKYKSLKTRSANECKGAGVDHDPLPAAEC